MQHPIASLFYFPNAADLGKFERFDVAPGHGIRDEKAVSYWMVTAYEKATGQNTVIADFHAEGMARTFRDMCAIVSEAQAK